MDSLRSLCFKMVKPDKSIELQIVDWIDGNVDPESYKDEDEDSSSSDEEKSSFSKYSDLEYNIKAYGNTKLGTSVLLNIYGFEPHFYVNIPMRFDMTDCNVLMNIVKSKLPALQRDNITSYETVHRIKYWGFTNNEKIKFLKINFKNTTVFRQTEKVFKEEIRFPGMKPRIFELYENNIPPLLRFFHFNKIQPAGWIRLAKDKYTIDRSNSSNTQIAINVYWKNVLPPKKEKLNMAPYIIASYDIECDSSHGDFPLPKKDYLKLAQEVSERFFSKNWSKLNLADLYKNIHSLVFDAFHQNKKEMSKLYTKSDVNPNEQVIKVACKKAAALFKLHENYKILAADLISNYELIKDNTKKGVKTLIEDAFCEVDDAKQHSVILKCYTKSTEKPSKRVVDNSSRSISNMIDKFYEKYNTNKDITKLMLEFNRYYFMSKPEMSEFIEKKKINDAMTLISKINMLCSQITSVLNEYFPEVVDNKEVKVKRLNTLFTSLFPDLEGDKVIQIGTAIQRFGETEPYLKHIITLGTCDPIEGTIVVPCKTEKEVLMEWSQFMVNLDPDIITGYNIFGFDYSFMYERARELDIEEDFSKISRHKDKPCDLFEKKLSSSALGDNTLIYIDTIGRINMDLLKVVQRDHNLDSYKLDFVAETFMNDSILEIKEDNKTLVIKNSKVLNKGNYITIVDYHGDKINDEKKFKIVELNKAENTIVLDREIVKDSAEQKLVKWCLAKDDVSPQDIFRLQKESSAGRCKIATYCIQDCVLVLHLVNKLQIIMNNIAMANTCSVPLGYIFLRGQGIKVFSLLAKECRDAGFLIPFRNAKKEYTFTKNPKFEYSLEYDEKPDLDDSYEGAIVLKPNPGIYLDKYVTVLDYSSLYPSSMISENLSHDSLCLDEKYLGEEGAKLLESLGYGYVDITHDVYKWKDPKIKNKGKFKAGVKTCRFVQPPNEGKSIVPTILKKLLKARKDTRAKQKTEKDEFVWGVLEGQQLSYKVTANSVYGSLGASTFQVCMKDIAASTTAVGRSLLELAQEKTLEKFDGAEIVYGDSVSGDTPIILRDKETSNIEIVNIQDMFKKEENYDLFKPWDEDRTNKIQDKTSVAKYEVFTSEGWSNINRVIKHKTQKKMYRITTHNGIVDVTEDHSLLNIENEIVKPTEIKIGQQLLHNYPVINRNRIEKQDIKKYYAEIAGKSLEEKKAFIYGFFFGDGSCGTYGDKYTWALNNSDIELCLILQSLCFEVYEQEFKILDTINSSSVYKIVPVKEIKKHVKCYRELFYNSLKEKIVPNEILNGTYNTKFAFISGYFMADGYKNNNELTFSNKGKQGTSMLYYLFKSIGLNVSINSRSDKMSIYKLTCTNNSHRKKCCEIKKIEFLGYSNDFVYDIETEVGNFNCGFELIVKNTDSIFINFNPRDEEGNLLSGKEGLKKSIDLGCQAEAYIQDYLKAPHKLEYEKTFWPFILFSKKRYIGYKYEFDVDKYKETSMGIATKRRDNAKIVKYVYKRVIDCLLKKRDLDLSIETLNSDLNELLAGKFNIKMLTITKSLKGFYANPEQIAHKVLADRMGERDPGNKPQSNDRIPYVYKETKVPKGKKILQGERVEHPQYMLENNIKPDYSFYITNQIMNPVGQIYSLIVENLPGFSKGKGFFEKRHQYYLDKYDGDEKKTIDKVNEERMKDIEKLIFGEALRKAQNAKDKVRDISEFFKIKK
jgi:DNA polymerase elongation subunit (family B)